MFPPDPTFCSIRIRIRHFAHIRIWIRPKQLYMSLLTLPIRVVGWGGGVTQPSHSTFGKLSTEIMGLI